MTIQQLLEMDSTQLAAMTPERIKEHFGKFLEVTRPEFVKRTNKVDTDMSPEAIKRREKIAKLQALGIDVSLLKNKHKL